MTWLITMVCLAGNILNCKKKIACFYLWNIGNILWLIFDIRSGLYSRASLDAIQLALGIYGIHEWRKEE